MRSLRRRAVAALVGTKTALYVCLWQSFADGVLQNKYGAIHRCRLADNVGERLCESTSLGSSPLDDCVPYRVVAGYENTPGTVYFFLSGGAHQPDSYAEGQRHGVWRYTEATRAWKQLTHMDFSLAPSEFTTPVIDHSGDFIIHLSRRNYAFCPGTETIKKVGSERPPETRAVVIDVTGNGHWCLAYNRKDKGQYHDIYRVSQSGGRATPVRVARLDTATHRLARMFPTVEGLVLLVRKRRGQRRYSLHLLPTRNR